MISPSHTVVAPWNAPEIRSELSAGRNSALSDQYSIVDDRSALADLCHEWDALAGDAPSPVLSHEWISSAFDAFHRRDAMTIVVVRSRGTLSAIAPLVEVRKGSLRRLECIGARGLAEPSGLLYRDQNALKSLVAHIGTLKSPLLLQRIPRDQAVLDTIALLPRRFTWRTDSGSPWLAVSESWEETERNISPHWRSTLRRDRRRAESIGEVRLHTACPETSGIRAMLEEFGRMESLGWKGRARTSLLHVERQFAFFEQYLGSAARRGDVRVMRLNIGERTAAMVFGVVRADRLWIFKTTFDPVFARCAPGILLMHEIVKNAFQTPCRAVEFLGSEEPWLRIWTGRIHPYVTCRSYPVAPAGIAMFVNDMASGAALSIAHRCRKHIR